MEIELDIFSGRPNPVWTLPTSAEHQIIERIQDLPPAQAPNVQALGYRGFVVRIPSDRATPAKDIRVQLGVVTIGSEHFEDKHGLERWLINNAAQQGHADLLVPFVGDSESPRGR